MEERIGKEMKNTNDTFVCIYPKEHPIPSEQRLRDCAAEFAAHVGLHFNGDSPILRTKRGKPFFEGSSFSFSITHSGDYWVCAIGLSPLGVDLQDDRPCKKESISRRFFHPAEQQYLNTNGYDGFFSIWAAKESYVKYTGEGISHKFSQFSVVDEKGKISHVGNAVLRFIPFLKGYTLCLCGENPSHIQLRWF